jgi:hypothetical protein
MHLQGGQGARGGSSSEGHFRNDLGLIGEHGLLESEHGACLAEGRERGRVGDVVGGDEEHGVEARDEIEDELSVRNGVADVAKRVSGGLDTLAVVGDGGVPLNKSMKLIAKVDHARLRVVVEEVKDHGIEGAGGLIIVVHGEGEDKIVNRGVEVALDGVVGLFPHEIGGTRQNNRVEEGYEPKLPDHGLEEGGPLGEVRPVKFEGDRHVRLDVDRAEGIEDGRSDIGDEHVGGGRIGEGRRRGRCTIEGHGGSGARVRISGKKRKLYTIWRMMEEFASS